VRGTKQASIVGIGKLKHCAAYARLHDLQASANRPHEAEGHEGHVPTDTATPRAAAAAASGTNA
jgi:hypothetical protein